MLTDWIKRIDAVIEIQVAEEVLVERLAGRFIKGNCGATYHKIFNPNKSRNLRPLVVVAASSTWRRCQETVKNRLPVNIKNSEPILAIGDEG